VRFADRSKSCWFLSWYAAARLIGLPPQAAVVEVFSRVPRLCKSGR